MAPTDEIQKVGGKGVDLNKTLGGQPWRTREREPIWGFGGFAHSGVQGQSPWSGGLCFRPPEAEWLFIVIG